MQAVVMMLLLIFLGGFADRIRGTGNVYYAWGVRNGELVGGAILVLILHVLYGLTAVEMLAYLVAWKIGESLGWSEIVGAPCRGTLKMDDTKLESWMIGVLKNWWLASLARGALWGLPMAFTTYFIIPSEALTAFLSYVVAFPLSSLIAMRIASGGAVWELTEWLRGGLVITGLIIGLHL